ncbi:MAG: DUF1214 domain-containing protein [Myxococcales bacterium]|nr:DUF1214 domain-containing protein [Myxococcales bacterium]
MPAQPPTESQKKLFELLDVLREASERRYGPEWGIEQPGDVAEGQRNLLHFLQGGLYSHMEADPARPVFRRIVTNTRKFRGDNPDAIYFDAHVRGDLEYLVRGHMAGAVYFSVTIEEGPGEAHYATGTAAGLNDSEMDIAADGSFEIFVSANDPGDGRNWLRLSPTAQSITTRHYFEDEVCASADPSRPVPLSIEVLGDPGPPRVWNDATIAAAIARVVHFVRDDTLGQAPRKPEDQPTWVSTTPNVFHPPEKPGSMAFSAMDIAYAMCPYVCGPDQALVMTGRFPECRFSNVNLWNRYMQTYDFDNRRVSLNRKQTTLEADGSFRMIISHTDPGDAVTKGNWLDTEGRPFGIVYWRFLLPEGPIETPKIEAVPLASLKR